MSQSGAAIDEETRWKVVVLRYDGVSCRDIANRLLISVRAVYGILEVFDTTGDGAPVVLDCFDTDLRLCCQLLRATQANSRNLTQKHTRTFTR